MVNCANIAFDRLADGKAYLKGTITGLSSAKKYCVYYLLKVYENLPNKSVSYTYIVNSTSYDLKSHGCYIPDHGYHGYKVYVWEIGANCEDRKVMVCSGTVDIIADETRAVNFRLRDADGNAISGIKITVGGERHPNETLYTDGSGKASTSIDARQWCTARCVPSGDWECIDCYEHWFHEEDTLIDFKLGANLCRVSFLVFDMDWDPMADVVCRVGGKSAKTDGIGSCSIDIECGTYIARCDIPSGYTCDCGGCSCEDGPFTLTDGYDVATFFLKKVTGPDVYCQQDFKVVDQNGDPVEKVILGGEDQSDFTNFEIAGHVGTGTLGNGTVSTLRTIKGRSYKFYISQFPPGYDWDVNGISIVGPLNACTDEIIFRVKNLSVGPGACSVNVCVQDQFGGQITGVAIAITDVGTVYTKDKLEMFGCTGEIGLVCGRSTTVTATVPDGYKAVETTKTFTADGKKTVILKLEDLTPDPDKVTLTLDVSSLVMAGTIEVSGLGPPNEIVRIMGVKSAIGFDWLAADAELANTIIDSIGTYSTEIELDEFGIVEVYAKIEKGGFWNWIVADIYSSKHTIYVLTSTMLIFLIIAAALVYDKSSGGKLQKMLKGKKG